MSQCMVKNGFFSLRDCRQPGIRPCVECRRNVCNDHLSPEGGSARCLDCVAKRVETSKEDRPLAERSSDLYDRSWTYRYRHQYYTTGGYQPLLWGHSYDRYYDDYDLRSFDRHADTFDDDPDEKAGFGDS